MAHNKLKTGFINLIHHYHYYCYYCYFCGNIYNTIYIAGVPDQLVESVDISYSQYWYITVLPLLLVVVVVVVVVAVAVLAYMTPWVSLTYSARPSQKKDSQKILQKST